jgi:uncharacterized protein YndB with AHSA1/START domain
MKKILLPLILFMTSVRILSAERAIELDVTVAADPARVWETWTTTEGVKTFFAPDARVELRVGGPFEVYFNPLAAPGMKGADGMRILAFQEGRMLSFDWNAPPHLPAARAQRTHVVVRLEAAGEGQTRVTLRHDGWGDGGEWDQAFGYFQKAWPNVLANLKKRFETGPVDWTEWMARMRAFQEQQAKAAPKK